MNVDVMVNGRPWKVALESAGETGKLAVTIRGRRRVVDASWIDPDTLSLVDGGAVRDIRLHSRSGVGAIGVETGGHLFEVVVSTDALKRGRKTPPDPVSAGRGAPAATGATHVTAPMPGRIVRVLVGVGDQVTARQPVVVVEAMKMENELRSPRDGVVKEVLVEAGAAVDSGAVLIVVGQ